MEFPEPWPFILLAVAAFRTTRFISWDDLTAGPRERLTGITDEAYKDWADWKREFEAQGRDPWHPGWDADSDGEPLDPFPLSRTRWKIATVARCPWCMGAYVAVLWWIAWLAAPGVTIPVAVPFALSASVGLIARTLDP